MFGSLFKTEKHEPKTGKCWEDEKGKIRCQYAECPYGEQVNCPVYMCRQAEMIANIGPEETAARIFEKILKDHKSFVYAINGLATCYMQTGDYEKAIEYYKKAMVYRPRDLTAIFGIVCAYYKFGAFQTALDWCDKYESISHDKENVDTIRKICTAKLQERERIESMPKNPVNEESNKPKTTGNGYQHNSSAGIKSKAGPSPVSDEKQIKVYVKPKARAASNPPVMPEKEGVIKQAEIPESKPELKPEYRPEPESEVIIQIEPDREEEYPEEEPEERPGKAIPNLVVDDDDITANASRLKAIRERLINEKKEREHIQEDTVISHEPVPERAPEENKQVNQNEKNSETITEHAVKSVTGNVPIVESEPVEEPASNNTPKTDPERVGKRILNPVPETKPESENKRVLNTAFEPVSESAEEPVSKTVLKAEPVPVKKSVQEIIPKTEPVPAKETVPEIAQKAEPETVVKPVAENAQNKKKDPGIEPAAKPAAIKITGTKANPIPEADDKNGGRKIVNAPEIYIDEQAEEESDTQEEFRDDHAAKPAVPDEKIESNSEIVSETQKAQKENETVKKTETDKTNTGNKTSGNSAAANNPPRKSKQKGPAPGLKPQNIGKQAAHTANNGKADHLKTAAAENEHKKEKTNPTPQENNAPEQQAEHRDVAPADKCNEKAEIKIEEQSPDTGKSTEKKIPDKTYYLDYLSQIIAEEEYNGYFSEDNADLFDPWLSDQAYKISQELYKEMEKFYKSLGQKVPDQDICIEWAGIAGMGSAYCMSHKIGNIKNEGVLKVLSPEGKVDALDDTVFSIMRRDQKHSKEDMDYIVRIKNKILRHARKNEYPDNRSLTIDSMAAIFIYAAVFETCMHREKLYF